MNNRSIRTTVAVFIFLLVVLVSVIQYSRIQASTIEPVLALVDVASTGASLVMEQMEVDVFAHLYPAEHEHLVAVPLTSAQLNILNVVRVPVQILEPLPSSDQELYVLFEHPEEIKLLDLPSGFTLLWKSGRYLLGRIAAAEAVQLHNADMHFRVLKRSPLIFRTEQNPAFSPDVLAPDPAVQALLNQVELFYAYDDVGSLSGEWPIYVSDGVFQFTTRHSSKVVHSRVATQYISERMVELGYQPVYHNYYHPYYGMRRNVVVQKTGVVNPDKIILLVAHLDSTAQYPYDIAPGADDNASGSAGVLIAAEILSQVTLGCTVKFIWFTGEEQGYYGSWEYAEDVYGWGDQIAGVINLDMIGYNSDSVRAYEIHTRNGNSGDLALAYIFRDAVTAYNLGLQTQIVQDGLSWSDHYPFWSYGYPAILVMEDFQDFTPYYHTTGDRLFTLDIDYLTRIIKAAIASTTHLGCGVVTPTPVPTSTSTPTPSQTLTPSITPTPTNTRTPFPTFTSPKFNFLPIIEHNNNNRATSVTPAPP